MRAILLAYLDDPDSLLANVPDRVEDRIRWGQPWHDGGDS